MYTISMALFETQSIEITSDQLAKWNVLFAIPCYDQQISEPTMMSLIKTIMYFRDHSMKFAVATITDSLINRARNNMSAKFMGNEQFTHMMFIDADISWEPEDILKLLWHDKEVMTAATTWGQLKTEILGNNELSYLLANDMTVRVKETRNNLDDAGAILPTGDFTIFLSAAKNKSGK